MSTRLERSQKERMIAGVCGGIAEYLQVDVTWVRLVFAILAVFGGIGVIGYIVLLIIMPLPGRRAVSADVQGAGQGVSEPIPQSGRPSPGAESAASPGGAETTVPVGEGDPVVDTERRRQAAGYALLAIGVIFLLNNQGVFRFLEWSYVWPLALIAVGVLLLAQRARA